MIRPFGNDHSFGTAFTLEVDERQYLITAKHVVTSLKPEDTIEMRQSDQKSWISVKVKVFRCDDPIDIAVLVAATQLTLSFPLEPTMQGLRYAQDMYFAGFPYGLSTNAPTTYQHFPIAFAKKAIMSASSNENGVVVIYLDGHNNPGFSGGPIIFRDLDRPNLVYKLAGVVSGYRPEYSPVLKPEEIKPEQVTPDDTAQSRIIVNDGHVFRLNDTGNVVALNTGIVLGYGISHAIDLIHKNPIGPKVSNQFRQ